MSLTQLAHKFISEHAAHNQRSLAVDATCGNGFDTEFLAKLAYARVVGFDVQAQALATTKQRLENAALTNVRLIHKGHEHLAEIIKQPVDCFIFNFGYLPGADRSITTTKNKSLTALNDAAALLSADGIMSLLCYPGHPNGSEETTAIQSWLDTLRGDWKISTHLSNNPNESTPVLYILETA